MKTTVYDKLKKCEQSPAWNRASAYVILKNGKEAGRIRVAHAKDGMGPLHAFLWDWTDEKTSKGVQHGAASGCGYNKLAAALDGMTLGDVTLKEGTWETSLRDAGFTLIQAL